MPALRFYRPGLIALLAVAAAAIPAVALWHFTVDDALISARYADHIALGLGYRFNRVGPVTDGVTPLGWPYVLAMWGGHGPLVVLRAAKLIGLSCWLLGAASVGTAIARTCRRRRALLALLLVVCSAPLAAWSVAGMETGFVLGLGALAAAGRALGMERLACAAAGLVAAMRPEALPWALTLALAPSNTGSSVGHTARPLDALRSRPPRKWMSVLVAIAPFLLVAAVRTILFGRPAPLAIYAKPSDFAHGWRYALACFLLAGPLAAVAWRRLEPWCHGLQMAVLVHFCAVAVAGGDWMPLSRLVVPVLPCVVLASAQALDRSHRWLGAARLALALGGEAFALVKVGPAAARVGLDRLRVIQELGPFLSHAQAVASVDIGWVGAATDADIVDLAGVTDPAVAVLPGGHTSKRVPPGLIDGRGVDTIVLLLAGPDELGKPWTESWFTRAVEQHVAQMPAMSTEFTPCALSRQPGLPYLVLARTTAPSRASCRPCPLGGGTPTP